ncbi:enoyl-CoA hydratase domain protein [Mycobacterium xenopi 3993]|nr:enoyl-CoA hydratase domain protein [Mycobacterium xenopi 3993]
MAQSRDGSNPRPPDGDWLGTPFLTFTRQGPFAICTIDRPQARNAFTPAMYFGIRYAISRVNADEELAGLLITGTGDVFAPAATWARAVPTIGWISHPPFPWM